ncbi:4'-phosphopantetheinyl transferase family protein [Undibacterium oligocarboniphilum]|uniref:4'-phosphopantetheinyl transferase domain-containing protein n=1 Tax=Undibacterium oligocarboniphilum TaxID=666702 RepID=A0A850QQT0_9BURK|nr:hypothetical protein [Undibacterium oligocarboniphilum]MBC3870415.1 hypothetical protein [Undibacterium oligocarboniphilum]NVO78406.1 hypothetical protein [Undibacterium oligocarboniphilum]
MESGKLPYLPAMSWPAMKEQVIQHFLLQKWAIIYLHLPPTLGRDMARQELRLAVTELLSRALNSPPSQIRLILRTGKRALIQMAQKEFAVSFSHESGLSAAAIHLHKNIAIDVACFPQNTLFSQWVETSRLYLGQIKTDMILERPGNLQMPLFFREWTILEASCKYAGIPLQEYSKDFSDKLLFENRQANQYAIHLPPPYIGSIITSHSEGS